VIFVAGLAVSALMVVVRVSERFSTRAKGSKALRVWIFGSMFWAIGTLIFMVLIDPNVSWSYMGANEISHLLSVMIAPPLFIGAAWFCYKRFIV